MECMGIGRSRGHHRNVDESVSLVQVSQETTIENYNKDLWKHVHPVGTVPEWLRNIVANRLARTAPEWASIFSKYNSGT